MPSLSNSCWQSYILLTGLLCLALDLVHLKYGVEVHLGNDIDENSSVAKTMFVATFGSLFVIAEVCTCPSLHPSCRSPSQPTGSGYYCGLHFNSGLPGSLPHPRYVCLHRRRLE